MKNEWKEYKLEQLASIKYGKNQETGGRLGMKYKMENNMNITNELDSTADISDEELTQRFKDSIRIDNEIRNIKGLPTAKFDDKTKKAYLEYPDGRRKYAGKN